jgi:hypothetical protein
MCNIDILAIKVKKSVEKLKKLSDENYRLRLELEYLRKESERSKIQIGKYLLLRRNAEEVATKIERIIKKIDIAKVS